MDHWALNPVVAKEVLGWEKRKNGVFEEWWVNSVGSEMCGSLLPQFASDLGATDLVISAMCSQDYGLKIRYNGHERKEHKEWWEASFFDWKTGEVRGRGIGISLSFAICMAAIETVQNSKKQPEVVSGRTRILL